jgi:hypothetical protein
MVAMATGLFLRIWKINAMGFNTDEAVYSGQAAAIAGVSGIKEVFPIFRAHPLLFQSVLSLIYKIHFSDLAGRLLAVVVGLCTIFLVYQLGKILYGPMQGALAALFLALMPYHVTVTRQVLLDGPMVFFTTLTLYMLARFAKSQNTKWLYASGATMGMSFLSKETSLILLGAIYIFLALSPEINVRIRDLFIASFLMVIIVSPFPISLSIAGSSVTGRNYLVWQLFRRPNHEWSFYLETVTPAIGILVILVVILGLMLLRKEYSWREKLLLTWIGVPVVFFQIWPVKGFQYLLPIAPAFVLLAGRTLGRIALKPPSFTIMKSQKSFTIPTSVSWIIVSAVTISLGLTSWQRIQPDTSSLFLAGSGGVPGGREAGIWIKENVPISARFMTIGPSMANIIQFYGERKAYGLSISPNPLRRNPSYEPIINPDLQIRNADLQYLVWDSFSAARSTFFSDKLLGYVNKFNGRAIHTETIFVPDSDGNLISQPIIIIYEVHP